MEFESHVVGRIGEGDISHNYFTTISNSPTF